MGRGGGAGIAVEVTTESLKGVGAASNATRIFLGVKASSICAGISSVWSPTRPWWYRLPADLEEVIGLPTES